MANEPTIRDILLKTDQFFKNKGFKNSRLEAELIMAHFLDLSRFDLYLKFENELSQDEVNALREAVLSRAKHKPLQYITQKVHFYNGIFYVNENVLIPRPETELMVEKILIDHPEARKILDIGTGSGAIAIALAMENKNINISAIDISWEALEIAKKNAKLNQVEIDFLQSDLFDKVTDKFDLIVSNPPYISERDYQDLEPELFFEPKTALVSDNDGLDHIFRIISQATDYLNDNGVLLLEIGYDQANQIKDFACQFSYKSIEVFKDLNSLDRIVRLKK